MHTRRLIIAAIFLPLAFAYVILLPAVYFTLLVCAISALAITEFYDMYRVSGPMRYAAILMGTLIPAGAYLYGSIYDYLALAVMIVAAIRLFTEPAPMDAIKDIAPVVLGLVYVSALMGFQTDIRVVGPEWIIFLYATIWGADASAYYVGNKIGKTMLYESVSPNKTMAGAGASVAGGALVAALCQLLLVSSVSLAEAVFAGAVIGAVTIVGDLVESMFKRDAGVKDSGTIVPGHGGILDKIDGVLFAGPVLYWILRGLRVIG